MTAKINQRLVDIRDRTIETELYDLVSKHNTTLDQLFRADARPTRPTRPTRLTRPQWFGDHARALAMQTTTEAKTGFSTPLMAARARRYQEYVRAVPAVRITLTIPSRTCQGTMRTLNVLLDTGSTHDWIAAPTAQALIVDGYQLCRTPPVEVSGANGQKSYTDGEAMRLPLTLPARLPGVENRECRFNALLRVMHIENDDIIMGVTTMHSLGLLPMLGEIYAAGRREVTPAGSDPFHVNDPIEMVADESDAIIDNWLPDVIMGTAHNVLQVHIDPTAPPTMRTRLSALTDEFKDIFGPLPTTGAKLPPFRIQTTARPAGRPPYRQPEAALEEIKKQVSKYLELDIIARAPVTGLDWPPTSPVLAMKSDGTWRFCCDYGPTNKVTVPYPGPIPDPRDLLERVSGKNFYCKLDFASAYHQATIHPDDRHKTVFRTHEGVFTWQRCPFGLMNLPAWWSQQMQNVFGDLDIACYLDDVVIFANTEDELIARLQAFYVRCREFDIRLKPSKCELGLTKFEYLGHVITGGVDGKGGTVSMSDERQAIMAQLQPPKNLAELRCFLGMAQYFHRFVPDFANIAKPLTKVCSVDAKKVSRYRWDPEQQEAFARLKAAIADAKVLTFPENTGKLILRTDASEQGIGAVLVQQYDDGRPEQPITFLSKAFSDVERRWSTYEQECFGIVYSVHQLRRHLLGRKFTVETDHKNLIWMHNCEAPKVVRWRLSLQQYDFDVTHIAGVTNIVADALSRLCGAPLSDGATPLQSMPKACVSLALCLLCNTTAAPRDDNVVPAPANMGDQLADVNLDYFADAHVRVTHADPPTDFIDVPDTGLPAVFSTLPLPATVTDELDGMPSSDRDSAYAHTPVALAERIRAPVTAENIVAWFNECHSSTVGHGGTYTTLLNLAKNGHSWPTMRTDIRRLVRECPTCQKNRLPFVPGIRAPGSLAVEQPFSEVAVDFMGPFPVDAHNNEYILVFVDQFSRYVELFPTTAPTAEAAANGLLHVFGRYGAPLRLRSDQGPHFTADVIKHFLSMTRTDHHFTTPYHHHANGTVERANREVLRHLRALVYDRDVRDRWSLFLPMIQRTINTHVCGVTGLSPASLIYGGFIDPDQGVFRTAPAQMPAGFTHDDYFRALVAAQTALTARALAVQNDVIAQRKLEFGGGAEPQKQYQLGDLVLLCRDKARPSKLSPLQGPYVVVGRVKQNVYQLEHMSIGKSIKEATVEQLMPYHYNRTLPLAERDAAAEQVAAKDLTGSYLVEKVYDHQFGDGQPDTEGWKPKAHGYAGRTATTQASRKRASWFKVKWKHYDDPSSDTWVSFAELANNVHMHEYVRRHPELRLDLGEHT